MRRALWFVGPPTHACFRNNNNNNNNNKPQAFYCVNVKGAICLSKRVNTFNSVGVGTSMFAGAAAGAWASLLPACLPACGGSWVFRFASLYRSSLFSLSVCPATL